jgi:hypothetical protein
MATIYYLNFYHVFYELPFSHLSVYLYHVFSLQNWQNNTVIAFLSSGFSFNGFYDLISLF